jgi:hypothetical protein
MGKEIESSETKDGMAIYDGQPSNNPYAHTTEGDEPAVNVPDETGKIFPVGDNRGNPVSYSATTSETKVLSEDAGKEVDAPRSVSLLYSITHFVVDCCTCSHVYRANHFWS